MVAKRGAYLDYDATLRVGQLGGAHRGLGRTILRVRLGQWRGGEQKNTSRAAGRGSNKLHSTIGKGASDTRTSENSSLKCAPGQKRSGSASSLWQWQAAREGVMRVCAPAQRQTAPSEARSHSLLDGLLFGPEQTQPTKALPEVAWPGCADAITRRVVVYSLAFATSTVRAWPAARHSTHSPALCAYYHRDSRRPLARRAFTLNRRLLSMIS